MSTEAMNVGCRPALEVRNLDVYYGRAHALQDISLTLHSGVLGVVGRNGMGKTTLCNAITGLVPARGSVKLAGREILGLSPNVITELGIGYVPQGRRVWPSLSVDEHLRLAAKSARQGAWTVERIYSLFPRLADRRRNGGAELSGGEQQMLAIGRALLFNPRVLVMDEPTEGLAPVIVEQVAATLKQLAHTTSEATGIAVLLIEQNIGVAVEAADRIAVMVNGRIAREMSASELAADTELQQRLLGVHAAGEEEPQPVVPEVTDDDATARVFTVRRAHADAPPAIPSNTATQTVRSFTRWNAQQPDVPLHDRAVRPSLDDAKVSEPEVEAACRHCFERTQRTRVRISCREQRAARRLHRRHVRYQRPRALFSEAVHRQAGTAHGDRRSIDLRRDVDRQRSSARSRAAPSEGRERSVHRRPRLIGQQHGDRVRAIPARPARPRRHRVRRRLGRNRARDAGNARVAGRHAEGDGVVGRLRRRASVRRAERHLHDVFGDRRVGHQSHQRESAVERRARAGRHDRVHAHRGIRKQARDRADDVRRHHAVRAGGDQAAAERIRLPGVSCHRHRRPIDGEAGRLGLARRRARHLDDRSVRRDRRWRAQCRPGAIRCIRAAPDSVRRLMRRARHGELLGVRHRAAEVQGSQSGQAQRERHVDAHHPRRMQGDRRIHRSQAESDGRSGALHHSGRRRFGRSTHPARRSGIRLQTRRCSPRSSRTSVAARGAR